MPTRPQSHAPSTGQLIYNAGNNSVSITMSLSPSLAAELDPSSFVAVFYDIDALPTSRDLPHALGTTSGGCTRYQWTLADVDPPRRAVLSMWQHDGTRSDLVLERALRGAA